MATDTFAFRPENDSEVTWRCSADGSPDTELAVRSGLEVEGAAAKSTDSQVIRTADFPSPPSIEVKTVGALDEIASLVLRLISLGQITRQGIEATLQDIEAKLREYTQAKEALSTTTLVCECHRVPPANGNRDLVLWGHASIPYTARVREDGKWFLRGTLQLKTAGHHERIPPTANEWAKVTGSGSLNIQNYELAPSRAVIVPVRVTCEAQVKLDSLRDQLQAALDAIGQMLAGLEGQDLSKIAKTFLENWLGGNQAILGFLANERQARLSLNGATISLELISMAELRRRVRTTEYTIPQRTSWWKHVDESGYGRLGGIGDANLERVLDLEGDLEEMQKSLKTAREDLRWVGKRMRALKDELSKEALAEGEESR